MASILSAGTTSSTGLVATADTSGVLQLATNNGTTAVTVDTSQNVGIGTSSPAQKLQVNGTILSGATGTDGQTQYARSSDGAAAASVGYLTATSEVKINNAISGPMTFYTANTERARIDSSGNLFVGGTTQNTANNPVYSKTTAKAWVNFSDNGTTCTINQSFNVGSITRNSTGNYGVNFATGISTSNSCAIANASNNDSVNAVGFINGVNSSTTSVQVISSLQAKYCSVVVFD